MTSANRISPFPFNEFANAVDEPEAPSLDGLDERLAEARREGFAAGRRQALDGVEQKRTEFLMKVETAIKAAQSDHDRVIASHRADAQAIAIALLRRFCEAFGAEKIVDAAERMVREAIDASDDRAPAILRISLDASIRFADELGDMVRRVDAEDFITIEPDAALAAGDCRLEWRTGAIGIDSVKLSSEIDALVETAMSQAIAKETDDVD